MEKPEDVSIDSQGQELSWKLDKNIRKSGTKLSLSPEHINEIARCRKDPIYFMENYCYINDPNKGRTLVQLYGWQKNLVKLLQAERFIIISLSRQIGKCVYFWSLVTIKHKKHSWLKIKIPIGILYFLSKLKVIE